MDFTIPFSQPASIGKVGGKGLNLMKLTIGKFNVPKGFVITTDAFTTFLKVTKITPFIKNQIGKIFGNDDLKEVSEICSSIENKIKSTTLPDEIIIALTKAFKDLNVKSVSVRSSGVSEDLGDFSFAGLYETFLNVQDIPGVCEKLQACWASMFNERCLLYQIRNGFLKRSDFSTSNSSEEIDDEEDTTGVPNMAVVVQEMIFSKFSGVMFSVDNFSENRDLLLINCSYGIGEGVVSGIAAVDEYIVNKIEKKIVQKVINKKTKAVVKNENDSDGVKVIDIDEKKQKEMAMTNKKILELANIGINIEKFYSNIPQDIEFAIAENDTIYVLQSRAITSLFPQLAPIDLVSLKKNVKDFSSREFESQQRKFMAEYNKNERIYANIGPSQMFTDPFTPLSFSFMVEAGKLLWNFTESKYETHRFHYGGGRMFFSAGDFMWKIRQKAGDVSAEMMDYILKDRKMYKHKFKPTNLKQIFKFIPFILKFYTKIIGSFCKSKSITPEKYEKVSEGHIEYVLHSLENYEKNSDEILNAISMLNQINKCADSSFMRIFYTLSTPAVGMVSEMIAKKMSGKKDLHLYISGGLEGNVTTGMLSEISIMAKQAKNNSEIMKILEDFNGKKITYEKSLKIFEENLKDTKDNKKFIERFKSFFKRHGFRAQGEIELMEDRYYEDASFIISSLLTSSKGDVNSIERRKEEAGKKSKQDIKKVIKEVTKKSICSIRNILTCGLHGCCNPCLVKSLIGTTRKTIVYREHIKYYLIKVYYKVKKKFLEIGKLLHEMGYLFEEKDVFFLTLTNIKDILESLRDFETGKSKEKILESYVLQFVSYRKNNFKKFKKIDGPQFMNNKYEVIDNTFFRNKKEKMKEKLKNKKDENMFYAQGVSPGKVKGRVRIIATAKDCFKLQKGEILVTNHTDPGYTPVFISTAGLVLEVGGSLTHGALIAREIGLPCVTGVENAMEVFNNGDLIEIDGWAGTVKVLERKKNIELENQSIQKVETTKTEEIIVIEDVNE